MPTPDPKSLMALLRTLVTAEVGLAAMGKSYADVIDTALDELFKKK